MRTSELAYQRTHPWLSFTVDLNRMPPSLWILLGEACSKCEHLAGIPLRPDTAKKMHRIYLAKGVRGTTAIEGNVLSEEEVLEQIEGKLKLPPSKAYLVQEVTNIINACENILLSALKQGPTEIRPDLVADFNRQVLEGLQLGEEIAPGRIRSYSVGVMGYKGAPAQDCAYLLDKLCQWLNDPGWKEWKISALLLQIVKAILAHLYIAWIHPFGDGNGRTARILEFWILTKAGVPTPAAHLLSNHYNETREEYYRQLEHASQSGGNVFGFVRYAVQGFVDGLRAQIDYVREQQMDVTWRNYVHEMFSKFRGPSNDRRRHLILDLSRNPEKVVTRTSLAAISPRVAAAYAKKTPKTLTRDIHFLEQKGLLAKGPNGYRAKTEIINAFLPARCAPQERHVVGS